jgi:hypothetical protein
MIIWGEWDVSQAGLRPRMLRKSILGLLKIFKGFFFPLRNNTIMENKYKQ